MDKTLASPAEAVAAITQYCQAFVVKVRQLWLAMVARPLVHSPTVISAPAPGQQSSVTPAGVTHLYDDRTGRIISVQ